MIEVKRPPAIRSVQKTCPQVSVFGSFRVQCSTYPSPSCLLRDEPATDGTEDGPEERTSSENRHGRTAVFLLEHVGDDAAPMVKQSDPPIPVSRRKTISVVRLGARAHPICHSTKWTVAMFGITRRPYISLSGPRNIGPIYGEVGNGQSTSSS